MLIPAQGSEQAIAALAGGDVLVGVPEEVRRMMVDFEGCASHYTTIG